MTKDSRLEKFLKALCSLDYSDLPTPLSRVEVLWNCLITGESTPDFQPQSRTEKYLMTILGVYDLEDIPKPISRAETLLYKLATGDTDVELEDGVKSRYELLLSEIVANGGVGDNVDFEYVTYVLSESFNTLYNTVDKSVKSAILKGQTLVNLSTLSGEFTVKPNSVQFISPQNIKQNTIYTIMFNCSTVPTTGFVELRQANDNTALKMENIPVVRGDNKFKMKTVNTQLNKFRFKNDSTSETDFIFNNLVILEGDYTNEDIPFFEGMQSVKMPVLTTNSGNLIPPFTEWSRLNGSTSEYSITDKRVEIILSRWNMGVSITKQLKPNTAYTVGWDEISRVTFSFSGTNKSGDLSPFKNFTTGDTGIVTFTLKNSMSSGTFIIDGFRISEGNSDLGYEPYKSTTVTCNEEVELRGIGDVKDELDLLTGEVVNKFGDVVLNGDENWSLYGSNPNQVNTVSFKLSHTNHVSSWGTGLGYCDKISFTNGGVMYEQDLECVTTDANNLIVRVSISKASSVDEFKVWLSNNNIRIVYPLKEEVIKTVDLSTLDQDGKETELKTFDDITHVSLSSEGLIPEAEMTVATKNLDDISQASTMSLRMNDISDRQNELQNEIDTQSETVDSTMMATTEIYEQTL